MLSLLRVMFIVSLFFTTKLQANDETWNYSIGISVKQLSLDVYEEDNTDPEGVLTDDFVIAPDFGLESGITYLTESNWGYKYAMNLGSFRMNTQEVGAEDVNLNTSASGYFVYAMPVAVYDFFKGKKDQQLLLGIDVGLGYLKARGDIIFTESNPQIRHDFDFSELSYAFGLYFRYSINSWSYTLSLNGPEVVDEGYEYNLFDFSMTLRKAFSF